MGSRAFISHPLTDSKDSGTSRTDTYSSTHRARPESRSGLPVGGDFRAPERSGHLGREHRSAGNRGQMAARVDFPDGLLGP